MVKKKGGKSSRRVKSKAKKAVKKITRSKTGKRKAIAKKIKKVKKVSGGAPEIKLEKIGEVTHFFPHVNAAAVKVLKNSIKVGDEIYIKGHTTDFKEKIESMQLDHASVTEGTKGQEIGLLVKSRVRIGDSVYRV